MKKLIELPAHPDTLNCESYRTEDGYTVSREEGVTPNGNPLRGFWVLRDPSGEWVDYDQYRNDLFERYHLENY